MEQKDLLYIVGSIRPHDEIKRNDACFRAGFLGSKIQEQPYSAQEMQLLESGLVKSLPVYDRFLNRKEKHIAEVERATDYFAKLNKTPEHIREAAARIAGEYSLVQGRKSPTKINKPEVTKKVPENIEYSSPETYFNHDSLYSGAEQSTAAVLYPKGRKNACEPKIVPISMQLMHREWNETYKFQAITQTPSSSAPEVNTGERFTEKLTSRSVSQIFEAAAYTSTCHEGFTTFLTLTFDKDQRLAIFGGMTDGEASQTMGAHHPIQYKRNMITKTAKANEKKIMDPICNIAGPYSTMPSKENPYPRVLNRDGEIAGEYCSLEFKPKKEFTLEKTLETTMGKEVSRFLDSAKKLYHRGWTADHSIQVDKESDAKYCDLKRIKIGGHTKPSDFGPTQELSDFHYIWVAESPANADGESNPHVHILLRWQVAPQLFSAWAKRLEKIWGHGFAKLERIRKPQAAGSYIIKAVGYAAKGQNADQGLIKGNRYNISKCSRAPAWECIASFDADNMTAIIKELGYKLEQWKRPIRKQVEIIHKQKAQTIVAKSVAKQQNKPEDILKKLQSRIIRLEKQAEKLNKTMKSRGVHVSSDNKFCITFEGESAKEQVDKFIFWAAGARGWPMNCRDLDLTDIKTEADVYYQDSYIRFQDKRSYWKAVLLDRKPIYERDTNEASDCWSAYIDYTQQQSMLM